MVDEVQAYIKSLNFGYRKVLREKSVTYLNAYAQFVDEHTVKVSILSCDYNTVNPVHVVSLWL
jgi:thioredoxin reductase (NADPH)